jgi:hypothetical protein
MSNVFSITIKGTNFIPIFVGLAIFISISIIIIGYIGDTSNAASDSLNETNEVGMTTLDSQFDSMNVQEPRLVVYSEVDPTYQAEIYKNFDDPVDNADCYPGTGSFTSTAYSPKIL